MEIVRARLVDRGCARGAWVGKDRTVDERPAQRGHRRDQRIDGWYWIRVVGVDPVPQRRWGNVSSNGVYFKTDARWAVPGAVERIEVATADGHRHFETLACVIRVVGIQDLWRGTGTAGAAFQFLPDDLPTRDAIAHLVEYVARDIVPDTPALPGTTAPGQSDASQPAVSSAAIVVDTDELIDAGTTIHITLDDSLHGGARHFEGVVAKASSRTRNKDRPYRTRVQMRRISDSVDGDESIDNTLDALLDSGANGRQAREPSSFQSLPHLRGVLSRVPLPGLLSLIEVERMSGTIDLRSRKGEATIYIREGRVLDVSGSPPELEPRTRLGMLVEWAEGEFELTLGPVDRPDRFGLPTRAILLDIVRQLDEARR